MVKFIEYLIIFNAVVNGIAFLIFLFLYSSLLVYRNATNFYIFIFYLIILLNAYIHSNSLLMEALKFWHIEFKSWLRHGYPAASPTGVLSWLSEPLQDLTSGIQRHSQLGEAMCCEGPCPTTEGKWPSHVFKGYCTKTCIFYKLVINSQVQCGDRGQAFGYALTYTILDNLGRAACFHRF